jgi:hypothetical protein
MAGRIGVNIVKDGLVLYLDAANSISYVSGSTTWNDLSRNGNNGTLTNGPTFSSARGGAIVFDGTNDYVTMGAKEDFNFDTGNFTVGCWFKSSQDKQYAGLVGKSFDAYGWSLQLSSGKIRQTYTPSEIISPLSYNDNNWHYAIMVCQSLSQNMYMYVDGMLIGSTSMPSSSTPPINAPLWIGGWGNILFVLNCNIAQTSIYNRALTSQEVLQNYNATKGRYGL